MFLNDKNKLNKYYAYTVILLEPDSSVFKGIGHLRKVLKEVCVIIYCEPINRCTWFGL